MDFGCHRAFGLTSAAIAVAAAACPAQALEIGDLAGRWSVLDHDECAYADDSEGAPLKIAEEEGGTSIGNYGWLCTVKDWTKDGAFQKGHGDCGWEGGDDPYTAEFKLGLNGGGGLLVVEGAATGVLRRCPAARK